MKWARLYKEIDSVLPCKELYVALYLQHLIENAKHYSVVESAMYSIKWAHDTAGLADPCDSDIVRSVVQAAKRVLNRPINKKEPVEANTMKKLFDHFNDRSSLKELRVLTMCSLMYTGFLRFSELCNIRARNLSFHNTHVDIFIEKSKTDCYRKGKNVVIARLENQFCPVAILERFLQLANVQMSSDFFIFRAIVFLKKSKSYALRKNNVKLSYTRTREIVKESLDLIGLDASKFGLHSFRAGGATSAANNDVSDRLFKIHGRWKSDLAKDGYVSDNLKKRLSVSKNLGL